MMSDPETHAFPDMHALPDTHAQVHPTLALSIRAAEVLPTATLYARCGCTRTAAAAFVASLVLHGACVGLAVLLDLHNRRRFAAASSRITAIR